MSRFDYVKYDEKAIEDQAFFKSLFIQIETVVQEKLTNYRPKALVLTKLEEAYMWIGKSIRDDQITRAKTTELQEERTNG